MVARAEAVYTKIQWHMFACQENVESFTSQKTEDTKKAATEMCWIQKKICVPLSHFDKKCKDDSKTQMIMMRIKLKFADNAPLVPETIISLKFYSTSISSICGELCWTDWQNQKCFLIKLWNCWFFYTIDYKPCYTKANFAYLESVILVLG